MTIQLIIFNLQKNIVKYIEVRSCAGAHCDNGY